MVFQLVVPAALLPLVRRRRKARAIADVDAHVCRSGLSVLPMSVPCDQTSL